MQKRYLSINELSDYIGIAKGTAYVWVCHRKIPYTKVGRLVKFDLWKIDKWLADNTIERYHPN